MPLSREGVLLQNIFTLSKGPVVFIKWLNRDQWPVVFISPNVSSLGYTPEDFSSGRVNLAGIISADDLEVFSRDAALLSKPGSQCIHGDFKVVKPDGTAVWHRYTIRGNYDQENALEGFYGYLFDISELRRAEADIEMLNRFPDENPNPVLRVMKDGNVIYFNRAAQSVLEKWRGMTGLEETRLTRQIISDCLNIHKIDGDRNEVEVEIGDRVFLFSCILITGTNVFYLYAVDVTRVKQSEEELKLASIVYESSIEGIMVTGPDGTIQSVNPAFTTITGYSQEEAVGKNPRILQSNRHDADFYKTMWESIRSTGKWRGEIWNRRKNNETYPQLLSITAINDEDGKIKHYVGVFNDIIELKQKESEIHFRAYHDPLTGLPNRDLFNDRLKVEISRASRIDSRVGVMFLDLDNFKDINDSLGHVIGDYLLQHVAKRVLQCVRDVDTVARIGGDEFTILLPQITDPKELVIVARRIMDIFKEPFNVQGYELFSSTSIGIGVYPADGKDNIELLKNADLAMYHAKDQGKNNYAFFAKEMNVQIKKRLKLENQLRRAMKKKQFILHYQPLVDMTSGDILGVEALVRWEHPSMGTVPPNDFIPLAEESGIILKIGQWVLEESCKQNFQWRSRGVDSLYTSINISSKQFRRNDFFQTVSGILKTTGLNSTLITLQITENCIMEKHDDIIRLMNELKNIGIKLSIDDFGVGYSSLSYLKQFPVDTLKIDQSFIRDIPQDSDSRAITKSIISLARNLGLKVMAEGVETKDQLDFLLENGCDMMQGYYFSPPVTAEEIEKMVKDGKNLYRQTCTDIK